MCSYKEGSLKQKEYEQKKPKTTKSFRQKHEPVFGTVIGVF